MSHIQFFKTELQSLHILKGGNMPYVFFFWITNLSGGGLHSSMLVCRWSMNFGYYFDLGSISAASLKHKWVNYKMSWDWCCKVLLPDLLFQRGIKFRSSFFHEFVSDLYSRQPYRLINLYAGLNYNLISCPPNSS